MSLAPLMTERRTRSSRRTTASCSTAAGERGWVIAVSREYTRETTKIVFSGAEVRRGPGRRAAERRAAGPGARIDAGGPEEGALVGDIDAPDIVRAPDRELRQRAERGGRLRGEGRSVPHVGLAGAERP